MKSGLIILNCQFKHGDARVLRQGNGDRYLGAGSCSVNGTDSDGTDAAGVLLPHGIEGGVGVLGEAAAGLILGCSGSFTLGPALEGEAVFGGNSLAEGQRGALELSLALGCTGAAVGVIAHGVDNCRNGTGLGRAADLAGSGLHAVCIQRRLGGKYPFAPGVALGGDRLSSGLAAVGAGVGLHAVFGAGGLGGNNAFVPAVALGGDLLSSDHFAAEGAGVGLHARLGAGRLFGHSALIRNVITDDRHAAGGHFKVDLFLVVVADISRLVADGYGSVAQGSVVKNSEVRRQDHSVKVDIGGSKPGCSCSVDRPKLAAGQRSVLQRNQRQAGFVVGQGQAERHNAGVAFQADSNAYFGSSCRFTRVRHADRGCSVCINGDRHHGGEHHNSQEQCDDSSFHANSPLFS